MTAGVEGPVVLRSKRRGRFGLDERRWPDPERVEAQVRVWLDRYFPEIWVLPGCGERQSTGSSLALLLPRGHVAMLRIERRCEAPGQAALDILVRCGAMRIPVALVSTLDDARVALRRFGISP